MARTNDMNVMKEMTNEDLRLKQFSTWREAPISSASKKPQKAIVTVYKLQAQSSKSITVSLFFCYKCFTDNFK